MENFISYCINPTYIPEYKKLSVKKFIKFVLLYLALVLFIMSPVTFLCDLLSISHESPVLSLNMILYGILIAPFCEEILFRLLLKPSKKNIYIHLGVVFVWLLALTLMGKHIPSILIGSMFCLLSPIILIYKKPLFKAQYKSIFYISAAIFALGHIFNFEGLTLANSFMIPILVIPQFILATITGYIRMNYGFIYAVFLHMVANLSILLSLL